MLAKKKDAAERRGVRERVRMARRCRRGKRGTRSEMMPRKRVTVCAGTSCEKATRKEVWRAMVPLIVVRLRSLAVY